MGDSKRRKILGTDKVPNGRKNRTSKRRKYDMTEILYRARMRFQHSDKEVIENIAKNELRKVL